MTRDVLSSMEAASVSDVLTIEKSRKVEEEENKAPAQLLACHAQVASNRWITPGEAEQIPRAHAVARIYQSGFRRASRNSNNLFAICVCI